MKQQLFVGMRFIGVAVLIAAAGCATTSTREAREKQFEPVPKPEVGALDLEPVHRPRGTTDLLREADLAFRKANEAQEAGDAAASMRHYTKMLELLVEADLDPVIFYNLRNEFARILDSTSQQAYLFQEGQPRAWGDTERGSTGVMGDLPIPFPLPDGVLREIEEIQEVYPRGFQAGLDRSFKYAPWVRREFEKAGLPQDLVWLAMVESQFVTYAQSPAGAMGMWQFMPATAQRYGLRVDSYVDERRDWEKATQAAIGYLSDLHTMFGDWALAVSAYNMGEGGLQRAMSYAGGETDLWRLLDSSAGQQRMREETRKFFPRLLASIIVASSPERYGFSVNPLPPDNYVRVPVRGSYSLEDLERASNIEQGTLKRLNPDLIRGVTPPAGEHMVAVPVEANSRFVTALNNVPSLDERRVVAASSGSGASSPASSSGRSYTVQRGDTLGAIANRYNVTVDALMGANNISSPRRLHVGRRLSIPGGGSPSTGGVVQTASASARTHRVRRGETLSEIAHQYRVSVRDLESWNNLSRRSHIRVNQELQVSAPASAPRTTTAAASTSPDARTVHVVRAGEFPGKIAQQYGVPVGDLLQWNNLSRDAVIRENDELVVYANGASTAPAGPRRVTHMAVAGDSAGKIAQEYGVRLSDFLEWNNLNRNSVIRVGAEYVIYADGGATRQAAAPQPQTHKVASGESPWTIARKHGVAMSDLMKWNSWSDSKVLRVGEEYIVYPGGSGSRQTAQQPIEHTVSPGQNPTTIARRYGVSVDDVFVWNNWSRNKVLRVGETVIIHR